VLERSDGSAFYPGLIIPQGATLKIQSGTKIHFHTNAGIICAGTLKCIGTKENPILMRAIRLTKNYINAAGQWIGLLFLRNSKANEIAYTTIDESIFGIWMGFQDSTDFGSIMSNNFSEIYIRNSTIKNAYYWAIRSFNNKIKAENSIFFTSTENLCQLGLGGDYQFDNCTFFNGYTDLKKPLLALSNQLYYEPNKTTYKYPLIKANFTNCIFASNSFRETVQTIMDGGADSNYLFENCLYRSDSSFKTSKFINCIITADKQFVNLTSDKEDFHLLEAAKALNAGKDNHLFLDFEDKPRNGKWDIGAYEKQ
jgi:hypothetical protein